MAASNYERQKKWREKNRALYNLQQRNRRKKKGGDAKCNHAEEEADTVHAMTMQEKSDSTTLDVQTTTHASASKAAPTVRSAGAAKQSTLTALRALMSETVEQPVADSKKPVVFRNDYGAVISEAQWKKLQELKRRAKEGGYTIDEYSQ